ncbi:MAG: putative porin [Halioglobus sp.]|nr:putative porin [Halioglobus sp.]
MKIRIIALLAALGMSGTSVQAHVSEAEWAQFKAEFAAMARRVSALEAENEALQAASLNAVPVEDLDARIAAASGANRRSARSERISWAGDFRYRAERIDEQGVNERDRNRIRARAALTARTSDSIEVGLGLASGGDSPISTNQTLGGNSSTKDLRLDLAYLQWSGLANTELTGGKFRNPFYRVQGSGLIWDSDVRPEGIGLAWDSGPFFATASYSFLESDSRAGDDAIWGLQLGARVSPRPALRLETAIKYLDIPAKGRVAFDPGEPDFFGNSSMVVDGRQVYAIDYKLLNASLNLEFALREFPVSLFADFVTNEDARELDTGYLAGLVLGPLQPAGKWRLRYQYQDLEADATFGLLADATFAGGGTDGRGHKFVARYDIDDRWYVAATYFDNQRGVDLGDDTDYRHFIFDTGINY